MKTFLLALVLTLAAVASVLVIHDRITRRDGTPGERLHEIEERLARIESAVRTPEATGADPAPEAGEKEAPRPSVAPADSPKAAAGQEVTLLTLSERLTEIEGMIWSSERELRRDLKGIYEGLAQRIDERGGDEGKAEKTAAPADPAAKAQVLSKLAEMGILVDEEAGSLSLKTTFAAPTRTLEYIAVATGGRAHESLLVADVMPSAVKIGCDILGWKEAPDPDYETLSYPEDATKLYLYVWYDGMRDKGRKVPRRVESMLFSAKRNDVLPSTPWIYTASFTYTDTRNWKRRFAADTQRSLVGLSWAKSRESLLACPLEDTVDETLWLPFAETLPEPGTEATLIICKQPNPEWEKS